MMKPKTRKKQKKNLLLLLIILGVAIGFAYVTTELGIFGTANLKTKEVDVHWENETLLRQSVDADLQLNDDRDVISYSVNLTRPGDQLAFKVDAKNDSAVDVQIANIDTIIYDDDGEEISLPDFLEYSITYDDETTVEENRILPARDKLTYIFTLKYKLDGEVEEDTHIRLEIKLNYERHRDILCKRATQLHTEVCNNPSGGCTDAGYDLEDTITYGNTKVTNGLLTPGDAFTCDVNGDGEFDEETERFYYVSNYYDTNTKTFNKKYAVLIYYNNVANGEPSNTKYTGYHNDQHSYEGPVDTWEQLPSTEQWPNVSLLNNPRQILDDEDGDIIRSPYYGDRALPQFEYTNRAARLLTAQEIKSACGVTFGYTDWDNYGELDACQYLMENTRFIVSGYTVTNGYWLETPIVNDLFSVYAVSGTYRDIDWYEADSGSAGARPVIDVPKSRIDY